MKLTTLICFLLFLTTSVHAQEKDKYGRPPLVPGIAELKIGDQVPDILIDNIINNDKRSIRTSDYKDKLLVLDFWDTTCSVCIASMPKLDSLQKVFGDQIKLLSVTWQPEEMITKFFKTNRFLTEHQPPVHRASVVDDRALRTYFRYETNPHVVWIYKGKVVAITGGEYITKENIQTLLDGQAVDWQLKTERFDATTPFLTINPLWQDATQSPVYGYSVLTGQATSVPEQGGINFIQDSIQNHTRVAIFNQSIFHTYQMLLVNTKSEPPKFIISPGRTFIEVKDPSRYLYKDEYGNVSDWNTKNFICYEQVKQGIIDKTVMAKLAIKDLNNRLGIEGRYEKRKVKCLVFVKTDKPITDTLAIEKGGMSIAGIVLMHLDMQRKFPPAIDETGFSGGLNLQPYDGTIAGLQKEVQRHGLDLIEAEREIEVVVISDGK
ncbi:TlpA family protein disulfide reductase [Sphingobacterium sp. UDSM-2020]|uniref:TlpA family protein disulfide reductase n=1 Tax=Sphingobacterium sp. UDSM-2020 TaxID=2795738 RepID=UPI001935AC4E|nr:redoxin domain-containing protein [Sphingobacterium sp. UDSM-2020]QQD16036.1 redoxin domain-containing protein [Sphingobacterium sp. UDSM-2020]